MDERAGRRTMGIGRAWLASTALLLAVCVLAGACGDSDDTVPAARDTTEGTTGTTAAGQQATTAPSSGSAGQDTLEGPIWTLQSAGPITIPAGVSITAAFEGGTVAGSAGCNRYTAPYELDGDTVTIGPAAATQMACGAAIDAAERAFLAALSTVDGYSLSEGGLELSTETGVPLAFVEQVQSVAGSWQVLGYLNADASGFVSVIVDTELTADFDDAGTVSGSAGCNSYSGRYQTEGTTISIGPLASTQMACSEPEGVMEQEQEFLGAMEAATTFVLEGANLVLVDAEGRRAVELQPAD